MDKNRKNKNLGKIEAETIGVEIDRTLSFDEHITSLCRKVGKKLSALARLSNLCMIQQLRHKGIFISYI